MRRAIELLIGVILLVGGLLFFGQIGPDDEVGIGTVIFPLGLIVFGCGLLLRAWLNQTKTDQDIEDYLATIPFADGSLPETAVADNSSREVVPDSKDTPAKTNPILFAVIFSVLFIISLGLMAALLAQNGRNLFLPEMRVMLLASLAASAYVSWRVGRIISKRIDATGLAQMGSSVAGIGPVSGMSAFRSKSSGSASMRARRARVEAKRRQLIAEGKLDAPSEPAPDATPIRVAKTAPIKDRMAARAERVRRAKEQGKLKS